jgi:hypothetical protein
VDAVLYALRNQTASEHISCANIAEQGCGVLVCLVNRRSVEDVAAIARGDVIDALYHCLRTYPAENRMRHYALKALKSIACVKLPREAAAAAVSGSSALVPALLAFPDCETVQRAGGLALLRFLRGNIAFDRAADAGVIPWLLGCLRSTDMGGAHRSNCLIVLASRYGRDFDDDTVSAASKQNSDVCVAAGAIEAVIAAMRAKETCAAVQASGCAALSNLLHSSQHCERAHAAGAVQTVVHALQAHAMVDGPLQEQLNRAGISILLKIYRHAKSCCKALAACEWEAVAAAMRARDDKWIHIKCCTLLFYMAFNARGGDNSTQEEALAARRLASLDLLRDLSRIMRRHCDESDIHVPSLLLLLEVCGASREEHAVVLTRHRVRAARCDVATAIRAVVRFKEQQGVPELSSNVLTLLRRATLLADALDRVPLRPCDACGATDTPDLRLCGRCRAARFCSVACQRAAWGTHRLACVAPAQEDE